MCSARQATRPATAVCLRCLVISDGEIAGAQAVYAFEPYSQDDKRIRTAETIRLRNAQNGNPDDPESPIISTENGLISKSGELDTLAVKRAPVGTALISQTQ